ncbi:hypothetical protein ACHAW5_005072 [Stephanodiscus triporus]|uniref:Phosphoribosylanthranilate isomerase n=1 Tax=Stephanodiscus triporus TaxID=2934178 RepID=A0ABD3NIH8_9STRA
MSSSSSAPPPDGDRPQYTDAELSSALWDYWGSSSSSPDACCGHILGYDDPNHEMSMLHRITATTILDLRRRLGGDPQSSARPAASMDDLLERARRFHDLHGPLLNLRDVIISESPRMTLAAEFKRRSPSKGDIAPPDIRAGDQARTYAEAGASVISVLTEGRWFGGSLDDLTEARLATAAECDDDACPTSSAPGGVGGVGGVSRRRRRPLILRKDFVTSTYQIAEAVAHGADSVLLIVATTPSDVLGELITYARVTFGMEPLVEVHAPVELDVALTAGARVIGVNNRDLHTFRLDMGRTEMTAAALAAKGLSYRHDDDDGADVVVVDDGGDGRICLCALSGMSTMHDVHRYRTAGVGMCLIGESLMRSTDPRSAIRGLCLDPADYRRRTRGGATTSSSGGGGVAGGAYTGGTRIVKVCGLTNPADAIAACRAGANLIGVIFAEKSGRRATVESAIEIVRVVREFGERDDRVDLVDDDDDDDDRAFGGEGGTAALSALVVRASALERASRRLLVVGVFQNQPSDYVRDVVRRCGLDMIQLHGSEGMEAANWKNYGVPAIRVVDIELGADDDRDRRGGEEGVARSSSSKIAAAILGRLTSDPFTILLDTSIKGDSRGGGGTGVAFDWTIAESIQNMGLPVIVAGGLTPDNVSDAVMRVRPWGVDVAGGVEASTGDGGRRGR